MVKYCCDAMDELVESGYVYIDEGGFWCDIIKQGTVPLDKDTHIRVKNLLCCPECGKPTTAKYRKNVEQIVRHIENTIDQCNADPNYKKWNIGIRDSMMMLMQTIMNDKEYKEWIERFRQ